MGRWGWGCGVGREGKVVCVCVQAREYMGMEGNAKKVRESAQTENAHVHAKW